MTTSSDPVFMTAGGSFLTPQQFPITPNGASYSRAMSDWMWGIDKVDTFNLNPSTLKNWRKAVANVRASAGRGTMVLIGDSTTAGAGSGSGGTLNYNGAFAKAYARGLAANLKSYYVPVSDNSFFNDQAVPIAYGTYDTRVSLGTGWTQNQASLGGNMFKFTTGSAGTLAFTPVGAFDTINVWYLKLSGNGSFTVNVDGGASLGTINTNAANLVTSTQFSVTKGTHTVNMVAQNDGNLFVMGCVCYDSTVSAVDLIQCGSSGAKTIAFDQTSLTWSALNVLPLLQPNLTVICLTINDSNAQTELTAYSQQMQAIITAALSTGDCVLMVGAPSNTPQAITGILQQYVNVLRNLALQNNIGLVDLSIRWTSYAVTNPILPYFDTLHPEALGYQDIAQAVFSGIAV